MNWSRYQPIALRTDVGPVAQSDWGAASPLPNRKGGPRRTGRDSGPSRRWDIRTAANAPLDQACADWLRSRHKIRPTTAVGYEYVLQPVQSELGSAEHS
jgi:hypothetical protein